MGLSYMRDSYLWCTSFHVTHGLLSAMTLWRSVQPASSSVASRCISVNRYHTFLTQQGDSKPTVSLHRINSSAIQIQGEADKALVFYTAKLAETHCSRNSKCMGQCPGSPVDWAVCPCEGGAHAFYRGQINRITDCLVSPKSVASSN
jgi:hypothetical protein